MNFNLDHAQAILSSTPEALRNLLQNLPLEWVKGNEGEKTWSPYDVIGHLIHGERTDWIPRLIQIQEIGQSKPFEPFDRFAQFTASEGKTLNELLDEFAALRTESLETLRGLNLSPSDLMKRGTHPELGAVTAEELLATWVVHDLDHVAQVTRTLAKQYRDAVGPWKAYLSVLK